MCIQCTAKEFILLPLAHINIYQRCNVNSRTSINVNAIKINRLRSSELWRNLAPDLSGRADLMTRTWRIAEKKKKVSTNAPWRGTDQILVARLACVDAGYLCEPALKHSSGAGGGSVCGVASSRRHTLCLCGCSVPYPTVLIACFVLLCFNTSASLKAREALLCSRNVGKRESSSSTPGDPAEPWKWRLRGLWRSR